MQHRKLWVDDLRPPPSAEWVWVKSYKSALRLLNQYEWNFDVISLDHDLGGEKTGYDVLCLLERRAFEYVNFKPLIGVHTANPVARLRMLQVADAMNVRRLKGKKK